MSLIDEEAARLAKLTNQVLQTAKWDEAHLEVDHEMIYVDQLFEFFRAEAARTIGDRPLRIVDLTSGSYVWADARLLQMAAFPGA